jgi:hypothetical protein
MPSTVDSVSSLSGVVFDRTPGPHVVKPRSLSNTPRMVQMQVTLDAEHVESGISVVIRLKIAFDDSARFCISLVVTTTNSPWKTGMEIKSATQTTRV